VCFCSCLHRRDREKAVRTGLGCITCGSWELIEPLEVGVASVRAQRHSCGALASSVGLKYALHLCWDQWGLESR
jgi:hypothetical protein